MACKKTGSVHTVASCRKSLPASQPVGKIEERPYLRSKTTKAALMLQMNEGKS
jgi:hypothetical protein